MNEPSNACWYYMAFGDECGPVTAAEIAEKVKKESLTPDSMVRHESQEEWQSAHEALPSLVAPYPTRASRNTGSTSTGIPMAAKVISIVLGVILILSGIGGMMVTSPGRGISGTSIVYMVIGAVNLIYGILAKVRT